MKYFNFWNKLDRTDLKTISFETYAELLEKSSEMKIEIHDKERLLDQIQIGKETNFYAFYSKVSGKFGYEWYTNLNFARSAQKELEDHLRRRSAKRR